MRKIIERRTCAKCSVVHEADKGVYGPYGFAGWLEVVERSAEGNVSLPIDFCSRKCLMAYMEKVT